MTTDRFTEMARELVRATEAMNDPTEAIADFARRVAKEEREAVLRLKPCGCTNACIINGDEGIHTQAMCDCAVTQRGQIAAFFDALRIRARGAK